MQHHTQRQANTGPVWINVSLSMSICTLMGQISYNLIINYETQKPTSVSWRCDVMQHCGSCSLCAPFFRLDKNDTLNLKQASFWHVCVNEI